MCLYRYLHYAADIWIACESYQCCAVANLSCDYNDIKDRDVREAFTEISLRQLPKKRTHAMGFAATIAWVLFKKGGFSVVDKTHVDIIDENIITHS